MSVRVVLFCLAMLMSLCAASCYAQNKQIILAADQWCPYNCEAGSNELGYMVDISIEIFEPAGYTISYENLNWARALSEARAGNIAGVIGAYPTDAVDFIFPTESLGNSSIALWTKQDNKADHISLRDLRDMRIGVIQSYSYSEALDRHINSFKKSEKHIQMLTGVNALGRNLEALNRNRIDVIPEDVFVMEYQLLKSGKKDQLKIVNTITTTDVFIAFSPKHPDAEKLAELLSVGIVTLRENGKLQQILDKYGLSDWQTKTPN